MLRSSILAVAALAILTANGTAAEGDRVRGAGYVPNQLVDTKVDEPLRNAKNVFDVYRVIVDWLDVAYPDEGEAGQLVRGLSKFVSEYEGTPDTDRNANDGKVRTIEMPMGIDQMMGILRAEAPGVNGPLSAEVKDNAKAQLFSAALLPFLQMRGVTYRIRPMVERSYFLHTMAVNSLRGNRHELKYNAGKNAMAIFEFLTYPMAQKGRTKVQFHTIAEVQEWIESQLIPTYDVAIPMAENALKALGGSKFESTTLSNFLVGPNPFPQPDVEGADRTFGANEVKGVIASMYLTRATLRSACAYNLDDMGKAGDEINDKLFKRYLKEKVSFGKKPRVGTPSHERYAAIQSYKSLFTLRNASHGPAILADLRAAHKLSETSLASYFGGMSAGSDPLVPARWFTANKDFQSKLAPQIRAVLAGPATLTDYVGGGTVDIDVPGFLQALPQDLKGFFPTEFDSTTPFRQFKFSSGKLIYSNYDYGNPTGWNKGAAGDTWQKLFPNVSDEMGEDGGWIGPMRVYRDLARTYLGGLLAPAIGQVMN